MISKKFELILEWLKYEEKRTIVDNISSEIFDLFESQNISKSRTLTMMIKEILKNSADHTDWNTNININFDENYIYFQIVDEWKWFDMTAKEIKEIFVNWNDEWRNKKWNQNFWIWLKTIKELAFSWEIDLVLHNNWENIYINDILSWEKNNLTKNGYLGKTAL